MQLPKPMVRPSGSFEPFSSLDAALSDLKIAMLAMSALVNYLDLTRDENNFGHFNFKHYTMGQYMRLDASAVQALSLLPNARETGSNKNMNLLGLLNKCKTAQGSRLIGQWLKQPLVNLHEISAHSFLKGCEPSINLFQKSDRTWSRFL
jgi:DNA mismatch repair protein MSH2